MVFLTKPSGGIEIHIDALGLIHYAWDATLICPDSQLGPFFLGIDVAMSAHQNHLPRCGD